MSHRSTFRLMSAVLWAGCAASAPAESAEPSPNPTPNRPPVIEATEPIRPHLAPWIDTGALTLLGAMQLAEIMPHLGRLYLVGPKVIPNGNVRYEISPANRRVIDSAKRQQTDVFVTVQNLGQQGFDPEPLRAIFEQPPLRRQHIENLVRLSGPYAGINLDYESLGEKDQAAFAAFSKDLAQALHRAGKLLSICVTARTDAKPGWDGARAFDWQKLGRTADEIVVMAYDFSYPGGPPGPVTPTAWLDQVLAYALKTLPTDKIRMGLPLYGYDWSQSATLNVPQANLTTYAKTHGFTWNTSDPDTWSGTYTDKKGVEHRVFAEPPTATKRKMTRISKRGVTRFAFWRAGYAAPKTWTELRR